MKYVKELIGLGMQTGAGFMAGMTVYGVFALDIQGSFIYNLLLAEFSFFMYMNVYVKRAWDHIRARVMYG